MPQNYVGIKEEEMMYLGGGYAITRIGIYTSRAASIANLALTLLNSSIGEAVAYALDRFDRTGLNGRIQF